MTRTTAIDDLDAFLTRWEASGAAERANCRALLYELCDLLRVPRPDPTGPDDAQNAYVFERNDTFQNPGGTTSHQCADVRRAMCHRCVDGRQRRDSCAFQPMLMR